MYVVILFITLMLLILFYGYVFIAYNKHDLERNNN